MKTTDHRITRNVLLAVYGTLLLLCTGIIVAVHINERRDQRREALERLSLTTSTLAAQVNANHLEQLLRQYDGRGMIFKNTQDARYYVLHELLRRTHERTGAALPVRIVVFDSLKQELQVVVTGEQSPSFRHVLENDATYIRTHYGRPARNAERDARLLAMDPIVNDEGRIMGMVLASIACFGSPCQGDRSPMAQHQHRPGTLPVRHCWLRALPLRGPLGESATHRPIVGALARGTLRYHRQHRLRQQDPARIGPPARSV